MAYQQEYDEEDGVHLLQRERACSSVRSNCLATYFYGGQRALDKRLRIAALIENDKLLSTEDRKYHQSQEARYSRASEKAVHFIKKCQTMGLSYEDVVAHANALDEILPIDVHMKMCIPMLQYQTTKEQREKWLPLAQEFRILMAYAQTELGHGSNVRGLETTATYHAKSESFVMNSPTLTSMKWWPGGLGKTSTHAIVLARLLLGGKDLGLHSFIVPIRSLIDHEPLPGVQLMDIGPKLGFNSVDNGALRLENVRIPRDNMLMGLSQVSADGKYWKKKGAEKVIYGAMLDVRVGLVEKGALTLARAVTIAVRYSCVRRQGFVPGFKSETSELQVLDYPTQQHALLPLIAWTFALQATGQTMRGRYKAYLKSMDLRLLPEIHVMSSGMKALIAERISSGVELCRRMCGGHGYLLSSGLPEVYQNYTAVQTFEGTQQILEPQLSRFLLRVASGRYDKKSIPLSADFKYLNKIPTLATLRSSARSPHDLLRPSLQIEAMECRVAALIARANRDIQYHMKEDQSPCDDALSRALAKTGVLLGRLSQAHCELTIFRHLNESVKKHEDRFRSSQKKTAQRDQDDIIIGHAELGVLRNLCHLFALTLMEEDMAEFRMNDYFDSRQSSMITRQVQRLCTVIRIEAVSLVDSFLLSDKLLDSALGRFDGKVYSALVEKALHGTLNTSEIHETYDKYWIQILKGGNGNIAKL